MGIAVQGDVGRKLSPRHFIFAKNVQSAVRFFESNECLSPNNAVRAGITEALFSFRCNAFKSAEINIELRIED